MMQKQLEEILDDSNCIQLNFPHLMLIFPTKGQANSAQKGLFEYFNNRELTLVLEYQEHSSKLSIYDVELGNDIVIDVPFCEEDNSDWFDNKSFKSSTKVSIFCGYGKIKKGSKISVPMADYIEGLDTSGIRNIKHFLTKRI